MAEQPDVCGDIISIMKNFNFHKPMKITVTIEDNKKNESKVKDYREINLMNTALKENCQIKNYTTQQQHSYIKNKSKDNSKVNHLQGLGDTANNRKLDCCQSSVPSNEKVNRNSHMKNSLLCGGLVNPNNNPNTKAPILYKSDSELVLINRIAVMLASVIEAYNKYKALIAVSRDHQYTSQLNASYLNIKLNMFQKCLEISNDFLLHNEFNKKYIKKLFEKTEQICKTSFTKEYFAFLYGDLLRWIRFKTYERPKNYQNKKRNENVCTRQVYPVPSLNPKSIANNRHITNIFSSGPPGSQVTISVDPKILQRQKISQSLVHYNTTNPLHVNNNATQQTNNSASHRFPNSTFSFERENTQQKYHSTMLSAPTSTWSNSMYYNKGEMTQHEENNGNPPMYTNVNQMNLQNNTRSSISRDSGFQSPLMSISPSEYYTNNTQYQSVDYEQQTPYNSIMPNTTPMIPNFAFEGPLFWNNI